MVSLVACQGEQEIPCVIGFHVRNLALGSCIDADVPVSGRDKDVAVRAAGKEFAQVECCIISIVK
jgi:hypothetical protein